MGTKIKRAVKPKIFEMDIELDAGRKDIGAYTIEHIGGVHVYHGSTSNLLRRVNEHQGELRRNEHHSKKLQEIFNVGGKFRIIFHPTTTKDEAINIEQTLIDNTPRENLCNTAYDARNNFHGLWLNPESREQIIQSRMGMQNGLGYKHSDESKERMAKRMKGNDYALGHRHSEETRKRMSESHKGKKVRPEFIRKSVLARIKGSVTVDDIHYESITEASRVLNISTYRVRSRCQSPEYEHWVFNPR